MGRSETSDGAPPFGQKAIAPYRSPASLVRHMEQAPEPVESASSALVHRDTAARCAPRCCFVVSSGRDAFASNPVEPRVSGFGARPRPAMGNGSPKVRLTSWNVNGRYGPGVAPPARCGARAGRRHGGGAVAERPRVSANLLQRCRVALAAAASARAATGVPRALPVRQHRPRRGGVRTSTPRTCRRVRREVWSRSRCSRRCTPDLPRPASAGGSSAVTSTRRVPNATTARSSSGAHITRQHTERCDKAERSVVLGLGEHDLPDVFRALNGCTATDTCWLARRGGQWWGRRYDHVFASRRLTPTAWRYLHAWREQRLSDHSAIEADLAA